MEWHTLTDSSFGSIQRITIFPKKKKGSDLHIIKSKKTVITKREPKCTEIVYNVYASNTFKLFFLF